jgi:Flp pilus assembly protein protease CpaA
MIARHDLNQALDPMERRRRSVGVAVLLGLAGWFGFGDAKFLAGNSLP